MEKNSIFKQIKYEGGGINGRGGDPINKNVPIYKQIAKERT